MKVQIVKNWWKNKRCSAWVKEDEELASMSPWEIRRHRQWILDEVYNSYSSYYSVLFFGSGEDKVRALGMLSDDLDVLFYAYLLTYGDDDIAIKTQAVSDLCGAKDRAYEDSEMHFKRCLNFYEGENNDGTVNAYDYV